MLRYVGLAYRPLIGASLVDAGMTLAERTAAAYPAGKHGRIRVRPGELADAAGDRYFLLVHQAPAPQTRATTIPAIPRKTWPPCFTWLPESKNDGAAPAIHRTPRMSAMTAMTARTITSVRLEPPVVDKLSEVTVPPWELAAYDMRRARRYQR